MMKMEAAAVETKAVKSVAPAKKEAEEPQAESNQLRENMQETAFFYPALMADKNGDVVLKFTLPESLTTWKFMGVAHTTDLCAGSLYGETIAQKDVMLQPNMPRFIRMGDQACSLRVSLISVNSRRAERFVSN